MWGRNEHHQLSYPLPASLTEPNDKPSPTPMAPEPIRLNALPDSNVPPELKEQKIVHAACGRGHTILVTDQGEAWSAGWNVSGQVSRLLTCTQLETLGLTAFLVHLQCGRPEQEHISSFQRIQGGDLARGDKIIQASAGVAHSLLLTEDGKVFAVGTAEKGILGNGRTGEHIAGSRVLFQTESEPLLVKGAIEGKKIVQITSGQQHNVALDSEGYCYAWGFGGEFLAAALSLHSNQLTSPILSLGLGRLGLGVQADSLIPAQIPYFANSNPLLRCKKIAAGSTNTLFIDNQDMVLLCGKFKVSGDGSAGQVSHYASSLFLGRAFPLDTVDTRTLYRSFAALDDPALRPRHYGLQMVAHQWRRRHHLLPRQGSEGGRFHGVLGTDGELWRVGARRRSSESLCCGSELDKALIDDFC